MMSDPNYIAETIFDGLVYGIDSPLGVSSSGTLETISRLILKDVTALYRQQYTGGNAQIVVVSNLNKAEILDKLTWLSSWKGEAY